MIFYLFTTQSLERNFVYVRLSNDFEWRIDEHNSGYEKTTNHIAYLKLLIAEEYATSVLARKREKVI
jgi:putative endonuclease